MLFNTIEFWLFFGVVWLLVRRSSQQVANYVLLGASYIFYGAWDWRFLSLIALSTVVDFWAAKFAGPDNSARIRRWALAVSAVVNLSILGLFKYFDFFVTSFATLLQIQPDHYSQYLISVALPVGISFYTFQTLSYTIDVYRGKLEPASKLGDFALYVAFFPQLVAGPIERGERFMPQIQSPRPAPSLSQAAILLIAWGLFKKMVIADTLSGPVDVVFASQNRLGPEVYVATVCFAFQIYCDFSGYTDIARGIARLLGFDLMLNFNLPYLASSPSDFWRRWHISLSTWLRDYLYIPLGGNRGGNLLTYRNLMATMVLGGLWHGARMNFVLWGIYHGALLSLQRIFFPQGKSPKDDQKSPAIHWLKILGMFHLTLFGWLLFRVESTGQLRDCCSALLGSWQSWESALAILRYTIPVLLPLFVVQAFQHYYRDLEVICRAPSYIRTAFVTSCLASCLYLNRSAGTPFIYFQF